MGEILEGSIDFDTEIRAQWKLGRPMMTQEVLAGGGLSGALIRILGTSSQVREILFDGKGDTINSNICEIFVQRVREQLGLPRLGGVKKLLLELGASEYQIGKWQKDIVSKNRFTSGKHDYRGIARTDTSTDEPVRGSSPTYFY